MSEFGTELRKERESRGIALDSISEATKISGRHLQALESSKFDQLWKAAADDATVRLLHPGESSRSLAHLALVLATADVIRSGLGLLGVVAAEEIR